MSKAEDRAVALMNDVLGPQAVKDYLKLGRIGVRGSESQDLYEVGGSLTWRWKVGVRSLGYCVQLYETDWLWLLRALNIPHVYGYPKADRVLTLALWIRGREAEFLDIANLVAVR